MECLNIDFMAYISYVISKHFHNSEIMIDVFVFGKNLAGLLMMLSSQTYHYWS